MTVDELQEKYKQAWKKFQDKMFVLRKRKSEVVTRLNEKMDKQQIEAIRKKLG